MRVCMVSHHGCIRVFKETKALVERGHAVEVAAMQAPFGYNLFDSLHIWYNPEQLRREVRASKADIFHVHNEPDWMVAAVKEAAGGRPVIYDVHDLESLRWQKEPDEDERRAFEACDGIVHVSEPCKKAADVWHGSEKPSIILYPYVNGEYYSQARDVSWSSLVYEGGLSLNPAIEEMENGESRINMRSYQDIVRAFIQQGYSVYLFGAGEAPGGLVYENLGAYTTWNTIYLVMLAGLRAFGFGLTGSAVSAPLMEAAMPNKLFEYISQGVVPVCFNASTAADFCEQHDIGIRLDGLENLDKQLARGPEIRKKLLAMRDELTMEKHIWRLEKLYEEVMG